MPHAPLETADDTELARLRGENALLRRAIDELPHGLCMFDADDRLLLANARYLQVWNLPPELGRPGTPFAAILAATPGVETEASRARPVPPPGVDCQRKREWQLADGRRVEVSVRRQSDGTCIALHEDVTEQRTAQDRLAMLARQDPLTGLHNRAVLGETLQALMPAAAAGAEAALLCLDLDRFKPVNDSLGHAAGDELLRLVAARMTAGVRAGDLVARIGGDEFAVLQAGGVQPQDAAALARRLIAHLSEPFDLGGHSVHIGVSIGVAVAPFDGPDAETLLRNADLALYRAKAEGRGTLRFFEPGMDDAARQRRALEADLHRALAQGEFVLHYQPQVDAAGGRVLGAEALLRWQHPALGMVSPLDFVPLAEETGLIAPIGRWVLAEACREATSWPPSVRVAVNVSAAQFRAGGLLADVRDALAASGLAPERLEVEITESIVLSDGDLAVEALQRLRSLGVRVALDDFGTGYSSLATLRRFAFDRIKIDRSFVRDLAPGSPGHAGALPIVRAVAALGASLGMATTAEGVETAEQLAAVQREGCSEVQGYLFGRPVPADEARRLISEKAADGRGH